jgi:phenylacetic acid degradation operon negative regulatory protein
MCGHAGAVGTLRPVRRLPPPARRRAPVAALVKLLAPLGIAPPAVRTAVSRMVRRAGCTPAPGLRAGLSAHPEGGAAARRGGGPDLPHRAVGWDGRFDLILLHARLPSGTPTGWLPRLRHARRARLGRARAPPRRSTRCCSTPGRIRAVQRRARAGSPAPPRWSAGLGPGRAGRSYEDFVADLRPVVTAVNARSSDEEAYAARFQLVHACARSCSATPALPRLAAALPRWPGRRAAAASSTGTRPVCAPPPTGTSNAAFKSASSSGLWRFSEP